MNWFTIYALFGAPILMLLVALAVVWLTGVQDKREARRHTAAE
jgi:hypothetical protein